MKQRTIFTPATVSDFSRESKLAYWKQLLPESVVNYKDKLGRKRTVNFDDVYLSKLMESFDAKRVNQTAFQLATADNAHNMLPERFRGEVTALRKAGPDEAPGLYGRVEFASRADAKAVLRNPGLGVSARIREDDDGPVIVHVLGTLDPQVTGMEPWKPVDLSQIDGKVLDLSNEVYAEGSEMRTRKNVAIKDRDVDSFTEAEIKGFDDEQLDEFFKTFAVDENGEPLDLDDLDDEDDADDEEDDDDLDSEDDDDPEEDEDDDVSADLSTRRGSRDIELANAAVATANERASEALRRVAQTAWDSFRKSEIGLGVPAHLLDLAEPVLNRPDDMEIDLSNAGEADLNVSEIVRKFVTATRGMIDMSNELGHEGQFDGNGTDPDEALTALWDEQYPINA